MSTKPTVHCLVLCATMAAWCAACGAGPFDARGSSATGGLGEGAFDDGAADDGATDEGTALTVTVGTPAIACAEDGSGADVTLGYTVVSTGAADGAAVIVVVDEYPELEVGQIAPGSEGWTIDGRTKTATGEASFTLQNGASIIVVCVVQDGAEGREPKQACSAVVSVDVDCALPEEEPAHCNQGVGNGAEGCDPGNSNHHNGSNDEDGGTPGHPGRGGGRR